MRPPVWPGVAVGLGVIIAMSALTPRAEEPGDMQILQLSEIGGGMETIVPPEDPADIMSYEVRTGDVGICAFRPTGEQVTPECITVTRLDDLEDEEWRTAQVKVSDALQESLAQRYINNHPGTWKVSWKDTVDATIMDSIQYLKPFYLSLKDVIGEDGSSVRMTSYENGSVYETADTGLIAYMGEDFSSVTFEEGLLEGTQDISVMFPYKGSGWYAFIIEDAQWVSPLDAPQDSQAEDNLDKYPEAPPEEMDKEPMPGPSQEQPEEKEEQETPEFKNETLPIQELPEEETEKEVKPINVIEESEEGPSVLQINDLAAVPEEPGQDSENIGEDSPAPGPGILVPSEQEDGEGEDTGSEVISPSCTVSITASDKQTQSHIAGTVRAQLIVAADIAGSDGSVLAWADEEGTEFQLTAGTVLKEITLKKGSALVENLYPGNYKIRVLEVPEPYASIPEDIPFTIQTSAGASVDIAVNLEKTTLLLYKMDATKDAPLAGVTFRVQPDEELLEDTDSQLYITNSKGQIKISNLKHSTTYMIREIATVPGYTLERTPYWFIVDENGLIDGKASYTMTLTNVSNYVTVIKKDKETGDPLPGASLKITNSEEKTVDEWTSTQEEHVVSGLAEGEYTLTEEKAPDGYNLADPVEFTVDGTNQAVQLEMLDEPQTRISVYSTVAGTSNMLTGCFLTIKDSDGNTVEEWETGNSAKRLALPNGVYTIAETKTPEGYVQASPVTVEVKKDMETTAIYVPHERSGETPSTEEPGSETPDTESGETFTVKIYSSVKNTSELLAGCSFSIKDKNGKEVAKWVSGNEAYSVSLNAGEYTIVETATAEGYNTASSLSIKVSGKDEIYYMEHTVAEGGETETAAHSVLTISKTEKGTNTAVKGAQLVLVNARGETVDSWTTEEGAHQNDTLPSGSYVLQEKMAPAGYLVSADVPFEYDAAVEQTVKMEDDFTKVSISIVSNPSSKMVTGASLSVRDFEGKVVETWTSEEAPHLITKLAPGDYTATEDKSPDGYSMANTVNFTVEEKADTQSVTLYVLEGDYKYAEDGSQVKTTTTGDTGASGSSAYGGGNGSGTSSVNPAKTGIEDNILLIVLPVAIAVFAVFGAVLLILYRRRRA